MNRFRWWRRLRGGAWVRVTGYVWGYRWVKVDPGLVFSAETVRECYVEDDWVSPFEDASK